MGKPSNRPPKHLRALGRDLWKAIIAEYDLRDGAGLALLRQACECRDLHEEAMTAARQDGFSTVDRYGTRRAHPLLATARDARVGMLQALRSLNLDLEPLKDRPGRPGGS